MGSFLKLSVFPLANFSQLLWVFPYVVTQHPSPSFVLLCKAIIEDFFDVVNHAIEQPLDIHLELPSQSKTI